jgi:DNA-binding MarR family transcriptional regulator/N-acetylglutamate synthase-like GNAT family acetyltransferase
MSYIKQLGAVAIASRLRGIYDILIRDAVRIYNEENVDFEPRWFTLVMLLKERGSLSVMEVAKTLNMTHPAVNQISNALEKKGLIRSYADQEDKRRRILKLSTKGIKLIDSLSPLWEQIEIAVTDLIYEVRPDLLDILSELENALERKSIYSRIKAQLRQAQYDSIEILNYDPRFRDHFRDLNYEWLNEYFEVEEEDDRILLNPEQILKEKGIIIFGAESGRIAGTAALIHLNEEECELTKMSVTKGFQDRQIGKKMMDYLLDYAKQQNYQKMILLTNPVLKKAVGLYKSRGFRTTIPVPSQLGDLKRPSIKMELTLSLTNKIFIP